ncbi:MAG: hypothetical protein AAF411_03710 [Myxococcota bacterium]
MRWLIGLLCFAACTGSDPADHDASTRLDAGADGAGALDAAQDESIDTASDDAAMDTGESAEAGLDLSTDTLSTDTAPDDPLECEAPLADCDGTRATGCEVDTSADARNCGACGRSCGASQRCEEGRCVERCPAGRQTSDRVDDESGFQVHALYVLPSDGVDRALDAPGGPLETSMEAFNRWLSTQTGGSRLRFDRCDGAPDITFVQLDRTGADLGASGVFLRDELEDELQALGFNEPNKLLAVYYDGPSGESCGGAPRPPTLIGNVTALYLQGTPPGSPGCNTVPIGVDVDNPGFIEFAMLHEIVHALGFAVGDTTCTPNLNPIGHVTDATDDLMYAGSEPWVLPPRLDVNRDDYYQHGRPDCLDLASSAFLDPLPEAAVAPPGW